MTEPDIMAEIEALAKGWDDGGSGVKKAFESLRDHLFGKEACLYFYKARPGVSYSIRAVHKDQQKRDFFIIFDVIDDDPSDRWLSICFYGDMISDPDEMGDLIPGGLGGDDGYCFDLNDGSEEEVAYVAKRIDEAWTKAAGGEC